jgi:hypothetical protein
MKHLRAPEVFNFLPEEVLCEIGREVGVDKPNHKITGQRLLKAAIYSLSAQRKLSLRVLEQYYNAPMQQVEKSKKSDNATHAGIADRISKIDVQYFEKIHNYLSNKYFELTDSKETFRHLARFDSTLVSIPAKLFPIGMPGGAAHLRFIKITVCQKDTIPLGVHVFTEPVAASEDIALKKAIKETKLENSDIVLFDRGIQSAKTLVEFNDSNTCFVTRSKVSRKFEVVQDLTVSHDIAENDFSKIVSDQKVHLWDAKKERSIPVPFRLVRLKVTGKPEDFLFLTNNFEFTAREVAECYERRWDIEVFFRFLKQELNLTHLIAHNLNGIRVFIYLILIFAVLFLLYKKINQLRGYKIPILRFFLELEIGIMRDVVEECDGDLKKFDKRFGISHD